MTEDLPPPCDDIPVIIDIEATVERAVDLVATGQIELGGIVVDIDDVWDQEKERVEAFVFLLAPASTDQTKAHATACSQPHSMLR